MRDSYNFSSCAFVNERERRTTLVYTNFGAEDVRPKIRVFKGTESKCGISFVSSHQVYKLDHMWVWVKILTVDQFTNIEKNEYILIELNLKKKTETKHSYITWNNPDMSKMLILMVEIEKLH